MKEYLRLGDPTIVDEYVTPEDEEPEPYCGLANEARETPFTPWRDIRPSSSVLLRPEDPLICPIWQRRTVSAVCREKGDVNLGSFSTSILGTQKRGERPCIDIL